MKTNVSADTQVRHARVDTHVFVDGRTRTRVLTRTCAHVVVLYMYRSSAHTKYFSDHLMRLSKGESHADAHVFVDTHVRSRTRTHVVVRVHVFLPFNQRKEKEKNDCTYSHVFFGVRSRARTLRYNKTS